MQVAQRHSAKNGEEFIKENHASELQEVLDAITNVDATACLRKVSREKTMIGALLYSPEALNSRIKGYLHPKGWAAPGG